MMQRSTKLFLGFTLATLCYQVLAGDVQAPSFVQGSADLNAVVNTKGKTITDTLGLIAVVVLAIGAITGIMKLGGDNPDDGRARIKNSFIGLLLLATLWGIVRAALA